MSNTKRIKPPKMVSTKMNMVRANQQLAVGATRPATTQNLPNIFLTINRVRYRRRIIQSLWFCFLFSKVSFLEHEIKSTIPTDNTKKLETNRIRICRAGI